MQIGKDLIPKGAYGYIDYKKKNLLVKTLIVAAFILAVAAVGYAIFGKIQNYLMIPAMVSVIPFANFLVVYIAMAKFRTAPADRYAYMKNFDEAGMLLSDLIIIDSKGARYGCEFMVVYKNGAAAYAADPKWRPEAVEIPVNDLLKKRGLPMKLKVYHDWDAFLARIDGMEPASDDAGRRRMELTVETVLNQCM